jgi:hypothetical protein
MCSVGHVHGVDFYRNPASASPGAWSALWCVAGTTIDHQELASGRLRKPLGPSEATRQRVVDDYAFICG